jgi:hypothetical protein
VSYRPAPVFSVFVCEVHLCVTTWAGLYRANLFLLSGRDVFEKVRQGTVVFFQEGEVFVIGRVPDSPLEFGD